MPALVGTSWGANVFGANVWGLNVWGPAGAGAPVASGVGGGKPRSRRALAVEEAWRRADVRAQETDSKRRRRRRGLPPEVRALEVPALEAVVVEQLTARVLDPGPGPIAALAAARLPTSVGDLVATTSGMSDPEEEALLLHIAEVLWNVS